jgi:hypothetical protein
LQRVKVGSRTMIRESELLKVIEDGGKSAAPRREDAARQRPRVGVQGKRPAPRGKGAAKGRSK